MAYLQMAARPGGLGHTFTCKIWVVDAPAALRDAGVLDLTQRAGQ